MHIYITNATFIMQKERPPAPPDPIPGFAPSPLESGHHLGTSRPHGSCILKPF